MKASLLLYIASAVACASAVSVRREPHGVLNALLVARQSAPASTTGSKGSTGGGSDGSNSGGTGTGDASACIETCTPASDDANRCPSGTPQDENNCLCNSHTRADVVACMNCQLKNNIYTAQELQNTADSMVEACASTNTPIDAIKVGDTSSGMSLRLGNRNGWMSPLVGALALFVWGMS